MAPKIERISTLGTCYSDEKMLSLTNCPMNGFRITINGVGFGTSNAVVLIGAKPCIDVMHGVGREGTLDRSLSCSAPAGTELEAKIIVFQSGGRISTEVVDFEEAPFIAYKQCSPGEVHVFLFVFNIFFIFVFFLLQCIN